MQVGLRWLGGSKLARQEPRPPGLSDWFVVLSSSGDWLGGFIGSVLAGRISSAGASPLGRREHRPTASRIVAQVAAERLL